MVVGSSQQEILDPGLVLLGTRQQGVPVILREVVLHCFFFLLLGSSPAVNVNSGMQLYLSDKSQIEGNGVRLGFYS
ncbi:unnamed protein product [Schistosoma margrebowiei]|uniref:Uncharacterized protein n=1 Tax=Schistosoma margrebowiei TaxID=48269 RepID=A0A183M8W2_9TREM|nr:unnamed protein product [Schistosoma margrebowiei]